MNLHPEKQMKSRRQCRNELTQLDCSAKYGMCINERANKDNRYDATTVLITQKQK